MIFADMAKTLTIFGLILIVLGAGVFGWVLAERNRQRRLAESCRAKYGAEPDEYLKQYNRWLQLSPEQRAKMPLELNGLGRPRTPEELREAQAGRLQADLDRLATGELDAYPFADVLYGQHWRQKVQEYKKRKERNEFILTGSVVCGAIGTVAFLAGLLAGLVRLISGVAARGDGVRGQAYGSGGTEDAPPAGQAGHVQEQRSERPRLWFVDRMAGWNSQRTGQSLASDSGGEVSSCSARPSPADGSPCEAGSRSAGGAPARPRSIRVVSVQTDPENASPAAAPRGPRESSDPAASVSSLESALRQEESLKRKADDLERRMAEFMKIAQGVRQSAMQNSTPINGVLEDLSREVSAIREYAAQQQQRVQKLQDGYDWNIIRTFCLRVIRCIDNIQTRIERLGQRGLATEDLEEVRDELVFALESSGVEQFEPELLSDYRGQEKCAEAVKERAASDDPANAGKIAKVIRPGYKYTIDENNIKVVRTAQVKLYA